MGIKKVDAAGRVPTNASLGGELELDAVGEDGCSHIRGIPDVFGCGRKVLMAKLAADDGQGYIGIGGTSGIGAAQIVGVEVDVEGLTGTAHDNIAQGPARHA